MEPATLFEYRVRERDLDNFLIEELHASDIFRAWLIAKLSHAFDEPLGCEVRLQKSPTRVQDNRQTDVRIGWFSPDGMLRACILIESKVTADFQMGQAESYLAEAMAQRAQFGQGGVATCLVAPENRMAALVHKGAFDAEISIEAIISMLEERLRDDLSDELLARLNVRIDMLEALCGRKRAAQWTPVTIEAKRDFAVSYAALAANIVPRLRVRPSSDGPKAITRIFEGLSLKQGFPAATVRHEFGSKVLVKYANIQIKGLGSQATSLQNSGFLDGTPYQAIEAGKALSIRVDTPGVDPTLPFDREREKVRIGLEAIQKLVSWLEDNQDGLAKVILDDAVPVSPLNTPVAVANFDRHPRDHEFTEALWATYRECEKLGYKPTGMLDMMQRLGGIGAARQLLLKPPSEGFTRLAELGRLDLAIESIVQDPVWKGIFSEDELRIARRRLR